MAVISYLLERLSWKKLIVISVFTGFVISFTFTDCNHSTNNDADGSIPDTIPLTKHWEKVIPHQQIPEGLVSLKAEDCGICHREIYEEWKQSTHALAFKDLQFQAEWKKDDIYTCLNCHAPLQNQHEFIITGLIDGDYHHPVKKENPNFDVALQMEGITCASCHVRNGEIIGTIGSNNAPHPVIKDPSFLSESLCISCHNVVDELNPVLVCTFETGEEWKNYSAVKAGNNCLTCHMPKIMRPIATGFEKRLSHSHFFPGSGIPKFHNIKTQGLNGLEFTPDTIKEEYAPGNWLNYTLKGRNSFAGHNVPTGDPERFFLIRFQIMDADSNILDSKQYRIGEEWQWYPEAKKLSDNNMRPLEERDFKFSYRLPDQEGLLLNVKVTKHRITEKNAELLGIAGEYPASIMIFNKSYPVRVRG